jgi:hypothetical protein
VDEALTVAVVRQTLSGSVTLTHTGPSPSRDDPGCGYGLTYHESVSQFQTSDDPAGMRLELNVGPFQRVTLLPPTS